ncbi:MAG: fluoride efflux transporter CrcB [Acidobacteriota bacterium]|nr:fluoride efflux transporter CrcB [Acidobacteriota bacterium]
MGPLAVLAIGIGAACGAWLRWGLGLWLNPLFPPIPPGTLAANLLGAYLMGLALAAFSHWSGLSPELKLGFTTGFLGGLTTFSTFSGEVTSLMLRQQVGMALGEIGVHVAGSLTMTYLGIKTLRLFIA